MYKLNTTGLIKYARLAREMRGFLKGTITFDQSQQVIQNRINDREKNFVSIIKNAVYGYPKSPYLALLNNVGCELGDIENQVIKNGIEATLIKLLDEGVYLSWEEFKGKKDVIRGSRSFKFTETDFDNPFIPVYYQVQSSGSRGAGTRTTFDFSHQLDMTYYRLPTLEVNNALGFPVSVWKAALPADSGINNILQHWKVGVPVEKWFSPTNNDQVQASFTQKLAMAYIIYGGRLWGAKLPMPKYVGLEDAIVVAKWMAESKKKAGACSLACSVSGALKVCQEANYHGLDINGTHFMVSGEPLTEVKRREVESNGATITSRYTITELGRVGCGCLQTWSPDAVHLLHDSVALIQRHRKLEKFEINVNAFLFTAILPSAPKILINVESGDYGIIEKRYCDCLFGKMGFNLQIHDIRSFTRLTGSGMTILDTDILYILEDILPNQYGGTSADYQFLEEELDDGKTQISLLISPEIGTIDEAGIINSILLELRKTVYGGKLAAGHWSQGDTIQIKRTHPIQNRGKVAPLHLCKNNSNR